MSVDAVDIGYRFDTSRRMWRVCIRAPISTPLLFVNVDNHLNGIGCGDTIIVACILYHGVDDMAKQYTNMLTNKYNVEWNVYEVIDAATYYIHRYNITNKL